MEVESMGLKPSQGKVAMDEEEDVGREMLVIAELDAILDSYSSPSVPMQPSTSGGKQAESKLGGSNEVFSTSLFELLKLGKKEKNSLLHSQDFRWNKKSQGFDIDGPSTSTGIVSGGRTTRKRPAPNMPDCEVPNKKIRGPDKKNPQYDSSDDSDDW
ncbi:uncharacterized protein LOC129920666 [Episyrphus balteatus]|uniref:uncharacterized protein LOC129920666 n=1 Tax=Episyrphus balteatus TaxID=286459 RepID=UPI002485DF32|nr:uncharacterized protein LOC129920666 [Episyrphus balteatus]